ncbi:hypothetical protein LTR08_008252 [Meristemomyces frigidus]|nr:hypothetical protein LTR08_008252 [Meristemomyces frigidus]
MSDPPTAKAPGSKLAATGVDFTPTIHNDTYDFIKPEQSVNPMPGILALVQHIANLRFRFDLSGRAVIVTGASKGIGRDTAISFARAGASFIAIGARSPLDSLKLEIEAAAKKAGRQAPKVLILQLDVSDYASVESAAKSVETTFGRLDILVNNAGYAEPFASLTDSKPDEWKRSWEVNVFGVYHMTRAFLPLLLKTEGGLKEIMNIASIGALFVMPGGSGYQAGKLAVLRFTEFTNMEYPEILAYSIHPGAVLTELAKSLGEEMQHVLIDQPQLAADAIVFLSAERRQWLSGRYVSVTWDMKELSEKRKKIEDEDLLKVMMSVGLE